MIEARSDSASSADAQVNPGHRVRNPRAAMIEQFRRLQAPVFDGTGSADETEQFLREVEKTFRLLHSTEEEKVELAEYQLKGAADEWWEVERERVMAQTGESPWENFKEAFMERFFPEATRENRITEFEELTQGRLTFEQYGKEFTRLAKYAPYLVSTPMMKAKRFAKGATSPLRDQLVGLNLPTFEEVLRRGLLIENARSKRKEVGSSSTGETSRGKRPQRAYPGDSSGFQRARTRGGFSGTTGRSAGSVGVGRGGGRAAPNCPRCGRNHFGPVCYGRLVTCFECGLPGHIRTNCPRLIGAGEAPVTIQQSSRVGRPNVGSSVTRGSMNVGRGRGRGNVTTPADAGASRHDVAEP